MPGNLKASIEIEAKDRFSGPASGIGRTARRLARKLEVRERSQIDTLRWMERRLDSGGVITRDPGLNKRRLADVSERATAYNPFVLGDAYCSLSLGGQLKNPQLVVSTYRFNRTILEICGVRHLIQQTVSLEIDALSGRANSYFRCSMPKNSLCKLRRHVPARVTEIASDSRAIRFIATNQRTQQMALRRGSHHGHGILASGFQKGIWFQSSRCRHDRKREDSDRRNEL